MRATFYFLTKLHIDPLTEITSRFGKYRRFLTFLRILELENIAVSGNYAD